MNRFAVRFAMRISVAQLKKARFPQIVDRPHQRGGPQSTAISYSRMINGLKVAGIDINRKVLSELAISDPAAFAALAEKAKEAAK